MKDITSRIYVLLGSINSGSSYLLALLRTLIFLLLSLLLTSICYGFFNFLFSGASFGSFSEPISPKVIQTINEELDELQHHEFPRMTLKVIETQDSFFIISKLYESENEKEFTDEDLKVVESKNCHVSGSINCLFSIQPGLGRLWGTYFTLWNVELKINVHPLLRSLEKKGMNGQFFCDGSTLKSPNDDQCKYTDRISKVLSGLYAGTIDDIPSWTLLQKWNGPIQFVTVIVFWMVTLQLFFLSKCNISLNQKIARIKTLSRFGGSDHPTPWCPGKFNSLDMIKKYETVTSYLRGHLAILDTSLDSHFLAIRRSGIESFHSNGDTAGIISNVAATTDMYLEQSYNTLSTARFGVWLIPTIGFIGTVVGIANALYKTLDLQSADLIEKSISKANVSAYIGTAFDTTLVALVLSVIVMGYLARVEKSWTQNILTSKSQTIDSLNHFQNIESVNEYIEPNNKKPFFRNLLTLVSVVTCILLVALAIFWIMGLDMSSLTELTGYTSS